MKKILDFFGSLRLTLGVLLGLALVSIAGTIKPPASGRYELFYQTPWFRLLLGLLALNLAVCTWRTLLRTRSAKRRLLQALVSHQSPGLPSVEGLPSKLDPAEVQQRLHRAGFRTELAGDRVLGWRGLAGRWFVPVLHLAVLVIMLGAIAAEFGFVGTINMYVGHQVDSYFDWDVEEQRPLGFTLKLDHFEPRYYPIDLRFATLDPVSWETLQVYTTREGETVPLNEELSVEVVRFFPEEEHLVLKVLRGGIPQGEYHALSGRRKYPNAIRLPVEIRPAEFRDPILKQLHSEVSIFEDGELVRQGVIEVNRPIVHRGVAIYQTAFNRDESGFWTCGFQLSKDPGEWLVWFGSVILCLALVGVFMVRPCAVGLVPTEAGWQLVSLSGFRGEGGRTRLQALRAALAKAG